MEIHDAIANIASLMGTTFDDAYALTIYFVFAAIGGCGFILSIALDVSFYVLGVVCRLLRKFSRMVRRLLTVHFQKH